MKKLLPTLLIFICLASGINAQHTITGTVVDEQKKPVDYVNVAVFSADSLISNDVVTDSLGKFELQLQSGSYELKLIWFGENLLTYPFAVKSNLNLGSLQVKNSIALKEFKITDQKSILKRDFDKLVFNVDQSPLKEGYNGVEVLKRTPRIQVNSKGEIQIRKSTPIVLINGKEVKLSGGELTNYLNTLNSEEIQRIEIQTAGSANTSAENKGGVINIVTKLPHRGVRLNMSSLGVYRGDEYYGQSHRASLTYTTAKLNLYGRYRFGENKDHGNSTSKTNFDSTNGVNDARGELDDYGKSSNFVTGLVYTPHPNHELGAEFYRTQSDSKMDSKDHLEVFDPTLSSISNNISRTDVTSKLWYSTLNYRWKLDTLGSSLKFIGETGNNDYYNRNTIDIDYILGNSGDKINRFTSDNNSTYYTGQVDWVKGFKQPYQLESGVKYNLIERKNSLLPEINTNTGWSEVPGQTRDFTNQEQIFAGYVSLAFSLKEKHNFKIGVRVEHTNVSGKNKINQQEVKQEYTDYFPSLFYSYDIDDERSLSFNYSRRIGRPSFKSLNPFVFKENDYMFQVGNPRLRPDYTDKLELSYYWGNHSFSVFNDYVADLAEDVFYTEKQISYLQPQNFGYTNELGLDYSFGGSLKDWLYVNLGTGVYEYWFNNANYRTDMFSYYGSVFSQFTINEKTAITFMADYSSPFQSSVSEFADLFGSSLAVRRSILKGKGLLQLGLDDVFNTNRDKNKSTYKTFSQSFWQKRRTRAVSLRITIQLENRKKVSDKKVESLEDNRNRL